MFFFIDREAGFYTGGELLKAALYLVIIAACAVFAAVSFVSKETSSVTLQPQKDIALSVLSALLSVSFLYDAATSFYGGFDSLGSVSYGMTAFQSMMLSGTIPQLFQSGFALLSAVYFLFFTKGTIKGKEVLSGHGILALAPVGWSSFRLIYRFVEQISYVRVSELLLELVLLALFSMFFIAFAQLATGVYIKNSRWRIVGVGLPAALISLTLNVPRMLYVISNGADELYSKYPFKVADFVLALFIIVLAVKLIKNKNKPETV